uniref:Uncharacterized protein n=1 Tax=Lepeophtheirus salmonis TaxID=72036 RepID=A0A0K2TIX9_LEPSM
MTSFLIQKHHNSFISVFHPSLVITHLQC